MGGTLYLGGVNSLERAPQMHFFGALASLAVCLSIERGFSHYAAAHRTHHLMCVAMSNLVRVEHMHLEGARYDLDAYLSALMEFSWFPAACQKHH